MTSTTLPGDSTRVARRRRHNWTFDRVSFIAVFLLLPLAIFVIFELSPYLQAFYYALTDWNGFTTSMNFVGGDNFIKMLSDEVFLKSVRNSVLLVIFVPTITLVIAFTIACVVTGGGPSLGQVRGLKGAGFYRVISFFPYAVPAIVIGIIWSQVFDPQRGLLNGMLSALGIHNFDGFAWMGQQTTALPATMFVIIWGFIGFYTILFVAAIKGIPGETYEAARLDGAGRWRIATRITLPQVISSVQTAYVYLGLTAIDSFVYMMALNPTGGPNFSTITMSQELYMTAFRKGQFGYSTAMGVVLAAVTLVYAGIIFVIFRLVRGKDDGRPS